MKPAEIRALAPEDRRSTLADLQQELMHERGVSAMGGAPPNPGRMRQIRRDIARILTIEEEERRSALEE